MEKNNWEHYSDSKILMMRSMAEDVYEAVKVVDLGDNLASFSHEVVFCLDYLATQSARSQTHALMTDFGCESLSDFEMITTTDCANDKPFDFALMSSLLMEGCAGGIIMSHNDALDEVYRITGCRFTMV